jgi:hypothetical protein
MGCYRGVGTAPTPIGRRKTCRYSHRRSRYRVVGYASPYGSPLTRHLFKVGEQSPSGVKSGIAPMGTIIQTHGMLLTFPRRLRRGDFAPLPGYLGLPRTRVLRHRPVGPCLLPRAFARSLHRVPLGLVTLSLGSLPCVTPLVKGRIWGPDFRRAIACPPLPVPRTRTPVLVYPFGRSRFSKAHPHVGLFAFRGWLNPRLLPQRARTLQGSVVTSDAHTLACMPEAPLGDHDRLAG